MESGDADPSRFSQKTRLCQLTDEEKLAFSGRKGKSQQERPYTAWFPSTSTEPLVSPPDLTSHDELRLGDIFWHKSPKGVQMWIWTETSEKGQFWKPVLLGHVRENDKRRLILTATDRPSWISDGWYRKNMHKKSSKSTSPLFVISTGTL
ncbi:hypothetical protein BN946_scf184646.g3 [Trametes cinnabarina]|uniref:Uncharacterized protein n=1 Tax=Pycnoporus cinnabarinus TaxID=5643 RepID=A0A060SPY8_PYCCI|nr:hypothetical protein BN946_scf184646.g3 [Trametes cinnabarina]